MQVLKNGNHNNKEKDNPERPYTNNNKKNIPLMPSFKDNEIASKSSLFFFLAGSPEGLI